MKTRKIFGVILCNSLSELTAEQQTHVAGFATRETLIARFETEDCDWRDSDVASRAYLVLTIKVQDILQHNPNEGVWIYGASDMDIDRVTRILGNHCVTARGGRIEGWR